MKDIFATHLIKVILVSHTAVALHNFQEEPVVKMYFTPGIPNSIEEKEYCPHWLCIILSPRFLLGSISVTKTISGFCFSDQAICISSSILVLVESSATLN